MGQVDIHIDSIITTGKGKSSDLYLDIPSLHLNPLMRRLSWETVQCQIK